MKANKTITFFIFLFSFFIWSCDNESGNGTTDNPADRAATITFGTGLYTTVTGHMTAAQWNAVTAKLTTALNAAANAGGILGPRTAALFGGVANIDLVTTHEYSYYKVDSEAGKFLFNSDYVIGASQADLSEKVATAISAAFTAAPEQE